MKVLSVFILLLGLSFSGHAQEFGRITGRVLSLTDQSGLSDVNISLYFGDAERFRVRSNRSGKFSFLNIPPGTYNIIARKSGFSTFSRSIKINPQVTLRFQFGMEVDQAVQNAAVRDQQQQVTTTPVQATQVAANPRQASGNQSESPTPAKVNSAVSSSTNADSSVFEVAEELKEAVEEIPDFVQFPETMPTPIGGLSAIYKNIEYPVFALRRGIQGTVLVKATVDQEGNVIQCEVAKGVDPSLDEAAINALYLVKFSPATYKGKNVITEIPIQVPFKIRK